MITSSQESVSSSSASIQAFVQLPPGITSPGTRTVSGNSCSSQSSCPSHSRTQDDWRLPDWGLGLTNIIQRPTAGIDGLKPREYTAGKKRLVATVKRYRPH